MVQMKEQGKNSKDQTNKKEMGKLFEREFRITIVKISKTLKIEWKKMQDSINTLNKDLEEIKNK